MTREHGGRHDYSYGGRRDEGFLLGIPSLAVSLVAGAGSFRDRARIAADMVQRFARTPLGQPALFNINVPDVPYEELRGLEVTRLGRRTRPNRW